MCSSMHSRKPDELYDIVESCSPGPYLELFARYPREGWHQMGDEAPSMGVAQLSDLTAAG